MVERSKSALDQSSDMEPVQGSIDVAVPADVLWKAFDRPWLWPRWNPCFFWCGNRRLRLGDRLVWCFEPIRPWYLYKFPAFAKIVELEPGRSVTWEVTAVPGMYARHTYSIDPLPDGGSRFTSWERAHGWGLRLSRAFWIAHFTFVKNRSLSGARQLEIRHLAGERLDAQSLPRRNYLGFYIAVVMWLAILITAVTLNIWAAIAALLLIAVRVVYGFYDLYVELDHWRLAPGVHAVLNGGGNTLVIADGGDTLLVDTKFPPADRALMRWLKKHSLPPVTKTVNTHYHYDHCQGNVRFPGAERFAHRDVAGYMARREGDWWQRHQTGLPNHPLSEAETIIQVGGVSVELLHFGPGHTHGDLVVRVPKFNVVATGDLMFNGYYMFFDENPEGVDLAANAASLRRLADTWPDAIFMPGHGPVSRAEDLRHFAAYIEDLLAQARRVHGEGGDEKAAERRIKLGRWDKMLLPWFYAGKLRWATARSNARAAWRLTRVEARDSR
jgi:glyoxylase-like metal-dependent hydrolase (beta-lactamase superfamily II)